MWTAGTGIRNRHRRSLAVCCLLNAGLLSIFGWVEPALAEPLGPLSVDQLHLAGARLEWRTTVPLRHVASIKSWHLVNGRLLGLGSDGYVHAVQADTGKHLWTQRLAGEMETLLPPRTHLAEPGSVVPGESLAFTLLNAIVFIDPATGRELQRFKLPVPNKASAVVLDDHVLQAGPSGRLHCFSLARLIELWQVRTSSMFDMAPLVIPAKKAAVFADTDGHLLCVTADRFKRFGTDLKSTIVGDLAADGGAVYAATADKHLHAVDLEGGSILWSFHLPDRPVGGPVVTAGSVYQATAGAGLQRLSSVAGDLANLKKAMAGGLEVVEEAVADPDMDDAEVEPASTAEFKGDLEWRFAQGRGFLAEWPRRVAVLDVSGRMALLDPATGELRELIALAGLSQGIANIWTDAVFLADDKGLLLCYRPADAGRVSLADYQPPPAPKEEVVIQPGADAVEAESPAEPADNADETAPAGRDPLRSQLTVPAPTN